MKTSIVIVAAGMGRRMNAATTKQLIHIGGKPILWHTLMAFEKMPFIDEIVLVVKEEEKSIIAKEITKGITKLTSIVDGGKERSDSVRNGLAALGDCEVVMIHDGARPFVSQEAVKRLREAVIEKKAAILAIPAKDTIKEVDACGIVARTYDRSKLWAVQTPQGFKRGIIETAYDRYDEMTAKIYDDAMLVEMATDTPVSIVEGEDTNIKITTPFDLVIGEAIYRKSI